MTEPSSLGLRLRAARRRDRLTQGEAAARMGFTRHSTVSDHERGQTDVSEDVLARYAALYGTSVALLRYGVSQGPSRAAVREHYALSDDAISKVPGLDAVLRRMPPHAYSVAFPLLRMLEAAGVSKECQDRAEVFLTEMSFGVLTPDFPPKSDAEQVADVRAAVVMLFDLYQRRGVALVHHEPPATDDPDAMTGDEFVARLSPHKRKPQAG